MNDPVFSNFWPRHQISIESERKPSTPAAYHPQPPRLTTSDLRRELIYDRLTTELSSSCQQPLWQRSISADDHVPTSSLYTTAGSIRNHFTADLLNSTYYTRSHALPGCFFNSSVLPAVYNLSSGVNVTAAATTNLVPGLVGGVETARFRAVPSSLSSTMIHPREFEWNGLGVTNEIPLQDERLRLELHLRNSRIEPDQASKMDSLRADDADRYHPLKSDSAGMASSLKLDPSNARQLPFFAKSSKGLDPSKHGDLTLLKRPKRKKDQDEPKRPLTAYNIFFRDERARLLTEAAIAAGKGKDFPAKWTTAGAKAGSDPSMPRRRRNRRKTHGLISFEEMARKVSQKWHEADEPVKLKYHLLAEKDRERYDREKADYLLQRKKAKCDEDDSSRTKEEGAAVSSAN